MPGKPIVLIPSGHKRGWVLRMNGEVVPDVNFVELERLPPRSTRLTYGLTPGGYDSIAVDGYSGVVVICYCFVNGKLYVGLIEEDRFRAGGKTWLLPGGGLDIYDSGDHYLAALRELVEEAGVRADVARARLMRLPSEPGNPNSGIIGGPRGAEHIVFAVFFWQHELFTDGLINGLPVYKLMPYLVGGQKCEPGEQIGNFRFFPASYAATCACMMTNAAVARLLAYLGAIK